MNRDVTIIHVRIKTGGGGTCLRCGIRQNSKEEEEEEEDGCLLLSSRGKVCVFSASVVNVFKAI